MVSKRLKLLLVEDDRATYMALKGILSLKGWDVTVATTVAEASAVIDEPVDAVILDLMLPDGTGEDLLERLRKRSDTVPIAVTTGVTDAKRIADVTRMAPTVVLRKPIGLSDLLKAITPSA